jgi:hypothetical protein
MKYLGSFVVMKAVRNRSTSAKGTYAARSSAVIITNVIAA